MPFDIAIFNQNINQYGVMKNNSFDVNITLPNAIQNLASQNDFEFINQFNEIQPFRAQSVSPPSSAFRTNETHNLGIGPRIKQPIEAIFPNVLITFLGDSQGIIEQFMTLWMNLGVNYAYNPASSGTSGATFYTAYRSQILSPIITINKYNKQGSIVSTYYITNAIPIFFITSPLSWGDNDRLQLYTLQLHFSSYDLDINT